MTEYFEAFDDDDAPLGLVPRDVVHARGLWHRSAHIFVFAADGRMLIQRRAADKDLYAGCWDLAVGEHLQPGETYAAGAARGLLEELGIRAEPVPVGALVRNEWVSDGACDREIQQAFVLHYDGPLKVDPVEVAEVRHIAPDDLSRWMAAEPEAFTPWFRSEMARLGMP